MGQNHNIDAAWQYHSGTKHSYLSIRMHPHVLDWENKPLLFKIYPTLEVTRLPKDFTDSGMPALTAIAAGSEILAGEAIPDLEMLAQLLFFSAGVTKSRKFEGGETFFRAAACTGALYEIELYFVCGDLPEKSVAGSKRNPYFSQNRGEVGHPGVSSADTQVSQKQRDLGHPTSGYISTDSPAKIGLAAGLYHFGAAEFGLRQLRAGDFRQVLAAAAGGDPAIAQAPVTIICTGTYWRNAWKYHSRTYRHFGWDNGTILANLLGVSAAAKLPAKIITGFVDSEINALVGLDTRREVAFSLVAIGQMGGEPAVAPQLSPLELPVVPYSKEEVDYPAMRKMHEASSFESASEVRAWRGTTPVPALPAAKGTPAPLHPPEGARIPKDTVEQVISRRGSTRQFARDPLTHAQLSLILERATQGIPADFLDPFGSHLNDLYLIINNVVGLTAGAYVYHWQEKVLELLKPGDFRDKAGYLGLEQQLPADAAVDVFFLADLKKILEQYGNRGYRAVQLEAGIIGGKLYLAAYAQRLGASGLTFYDDDVVSFFSPHARGKSAIFLVALGRSARK